MSFTKDHQQRKIRVDEVFYQLGKIFWLPFCLFGFWFARAGYERYGELAGCFIRRLCGFPCPGCGGTRAFYYLFRGDLFESFRLNPIMIYGVLAYLHFMLLFFYRRHTGYVNASKKEIRIEYYLYVAVVILLVQWAVKIINIIWALLG